MENTGSFPNIVGTNDKIYAIYKTVNINNNDVIRVKYSTDNGDTWESNSNLDRIISNEDCNGVDAVYELGNGVHVVWGLRDSDPNFETYYARITYTTPHTWTDYKNVTDDGAAQYGGNPSVVVSPNRVHVSFNTDATNTNYGTGNVKTRDKNNGVWDDPQSVVSGSEYSVDEQLLVWGDFLYLFYNCDVSPNALRFRTRSLSSNSWSIFTTVDPGIKQFDFAFEVTKTTNNDIHIIFKRIFQKADAYSYIKSTDAGTSWSSPFNFDNSVDLLRQMGLSSVSDDLFCTWVNSETSYFKQYDANPLAPQNLTYQVTTDYHPKLIWNTNTEPDMQSYYVYRSASGGYTQITTVTNNKNYSTHNYTDTYITIPIPGGQAGATYGYVVSAVDLGQHVSSYSNQINVTSNQFAIEKSSGNGVGEIIDYELMQNYPNPFNPSTIITYSIKEEGLVTLKVYDILGKEIATLVNENKPSGIYETEFNASQLPSGMYIYKIQAGSFSNVKKMLLTK